MIRASRATARVTRMVTYMTRDEWLGRFAKAAGVGEPDARHVEVLLELAGIAAHSSERTAAPVTCWLAACAGLNPDQALELARRVAAEASRSG